MLITRKYGRCLTSVYRKSSFTGQYLNFQFSCSKIIKVGLIKTLYHRAKKICSLELFLNETKEIKEILLKNGYPDTVIERVFNQESKRLKNNIIYDPEKCSLALVLPYIALQSTSFEP